MPKTKQVHFRNIWLEDKAHQPWLERDADDCKFYCSWCKESMNLSNMGICAVKSHKMSVKHQKRTKNRSSTRQINSFFGTRQDSIRASSSSSSASIPSSSLAITPSSSLPSTPSSSLPSTPSSSSVSTPFSSWPSKAVCNTGKDAEIVWSLTVVEKNLPVNVCEGMGATFVKMFGEAAAGFAMAPTKLTYTINHGLAPHFTNILIADIKKSPFFTVSFDESFNDALQKTQMDFVARFWNHNKMECVSQYFSSKFLGTCNSNILKDNFLSAIEPVDSTKLVQIAMDGRNVNWAMYKQVVEKRQVDHLPELVNFGTCSLHIIYGAFKRGSDATHWDVTKLLKNLSYIFHDHPNRREFYEATTGSNSFPFGICTIRWLERIPVAERAIQEWKNTCICFREWRKMPLYKRPQGKPFNVVSKAVDDCATVAKLQFFCYIAGFLKPFLEKYQSTKPLVPFMYNDIFEIFENLMSLILKPHFLKTVLQKGLVLLASTKLNVEKEMRHVVDIGCAANNELTRLQNQDLMDATTAFVFHNQCRSFVLAILEKLQDKLLQGVVFLRRVSSLDPANISMLGIDKVIRLYQKLVCTLTKRSILPAKDGDQSILDFKKLVSSQYSSRLLATYTQSQRLDTFYFDTLEANKLYPSLTLVLQLVFVLFHGQAEVERGFSINKAMLQNNMKEGTVVSRRVVKGFLKANNVKAVDVEITRELRKSVQCVSSRYRIYLKEQKQMRKEQQKEKRENMFVERLRILCKEEKEQFLTVLNEDAMAMFVKAGKEKDVVQSQLLLAKGSGVKDKAEKVEVKELAEKIKVLKEEKTMF